MKPRTAKTAPARTIVKPKADAKRSRAPIQGQYGPSTNNAWQLERGTISLVRRPPRPRPVKVAAEPLPLEFDLTRAALIVIDMQNDFCHPCGWFGQKGIDTRPVRKPIPVIAKLLTAWRDAGARVVWVNWGVRPDRANLSPTLHFKSKYRPLEGIDTPGYAERSPDDRGRAVVAGDWGAQVVDELPVAPEDITVFKHRLSGFWDNELDSVLRMQGITTLFFAGVNTDRCVFSTLQDACFLGYDCVLLDDACSTVSPAYVSRAIHYIVKQLHGFVAGSTALLAGLNRISRSTSSRSSS